MLVLTFQVGSSRLALDIRHVREVVPRVPLQHAVGSPAWIAGVFVYRGQPVPVLDLHRLLGAGECPPHLSSRIILVPLGGGPSRREALLGLLAAGVSDIRSLEPSSAALPSLASPGQPDLGMTLIEEGGILHLIDLDRLLPEPVRDLLLSP